MRKSTKFWLIAAALLIVLGFAMFTAVMMGPNWDFTRLSTAKYQTNTYQLKEAFHNISIQTDTADIVFATSDDGVAKVVCYEMENAKHSVTIQDGTLSILLEDRREWYEQIGIFVDSPQVTVYIPQGVQFASIKVKASTGGIYTEDVSTDSLELSVSTGHIRVSNITCENTVTIHVSTGETHIADLKCKNFTSTGDTGDITLRNVIASEKLSIERSTGDIEFADCDAAEIFIKTDTGDVEGTLLTGKVFVVETDTGSIEVPPNTTGGKCQISTDTGDIQIDISR